MLKLQDVRPGDVLLCRPPLGLCLSKPVRELITVVTGSPYTHAAIAISEADVLDVRPRHGVMVRPLAALVSEAMHIAVLRHPDAWDDVRIDGLRDYAAALQALGTGYNYREALRYIANNRAHEAGMTDALTQYFGNGEQHPPTDLGPFFCSELVAACFVNSGFIHPSAAVVIAPGVQAPGDLANEPTFGFLVGFVALDPSATVPEDDPLLTLARYDEVLGL